MIPYRDENPTRSFPLFTMLIIIANFAVFLYQQSLPEPLQKDFVLYYAAVPGHVVGGQNFGFDRLEPGWLTIFTSMFMHGSWFHLLGNMLFLWIFGNNIEDLTGKLRFLLFYPLCGFAAAALQIMMSLGPHVEQIPMVGASGAIAGVLGAYFVKFPTARVRTLLLLFPFITRVSLPAWAVLGFWFVMQFFSAMANAAVGLSGGGVAFFAHVGGFLCGAILIPFFATRRPRLLME